MHALIPFTKYHANGNDFILILAEYFPDKFRVPGKIARLCNRHTGIGADGLFVISSSEKCEFKLDYFNSDGSWETLCANGSRCAARFMYDKNLRNEKIRFEAGDGEHWAKIQKNGKVAMGMATPRYKSKNISLGNYSGYSVDSGAPHFVCESDMLDDDFVYNKGREIRNSGYFKPRGINVNFYRTIDKNSIEIRTYEKGVEQVMLSCASGSTAVVYHLATQGVVHSPVTTYSAGGSLLFSFDPDWRDAWMEGPAKFIYSGEFDHALLNL